MVVSTLQTVLFRVTVGLLGIVILYFFSSMVFFLLKVLVGKIRSRRKWHHLMILYDVLFNDRPLESLSSGVLHRTSLIEAFIEALSMITGSMQEKIKNAVIRLGFLQNIQRWLFSIAPTKRMRACYTLGLLGSEDQAELLTAKLNDLNKKVVSSAIIALGEIRAIETVPAILNYFRRCPQQHAWLISAIIPFFGAKIHRYIKPLVSDRDLPAGKKLLLIKALAVLKPPEIVPDLIRLYQESDNIDIRVSALVTAGTINDLSAVKAVIDALEDSAWEVRAVAAGIIGEMAIKGAAYRLVALLKDRNWYVRKNAARSLSKLGFIGISALVDGIESDDRFARDICVQTLEENGLVEEMIEELRSGKGKKAELAKKTIRLLIKSGHTNYIQNFKNTGVVSRRPADDQKKEEKKPSGHHDTITLEKPV